MLPAGFMSLASLKSRLLPAAAVEDTDWDTQIAALGRAMARRMESHANRVLGRVVGKTDRLSAEASGWTLAAFPVESITSATLVIGSGTSTLIDASNYMLDPEAGILRTYGALGSKFDSILVVYTGGYWLDPEDGNTLPTGSTPMPEDILEAWVAECQAMAEDRELFRATGLRAPAKGIAGTRVRPDGLLESTRQALAPYIRYS